MCLCPSRDEHGDDEGVGHEKDFGDHLVALVLELERPNGLIEKAPKTQIRRLGDKCREVGEERLDALEQTGVCLELPLRRCANRFREEKTLRGRKGPDLDDLQNDMENVYTVLNP